MGTFPKSLYFTLVIFYFCEGKKRTANGKKVTTCNLLISLESQTPKIISLPLHLTILFKTKEKTHGAV